ncbi:hypothetical protein [Oceanobacillus massiliensis]|uniref:hypothetical protein n=1 Tax=Oceanobacillus massiliensis TaxID=1465765 RepID=UPI00301AB8DB
MNETQFTSLITQTTNLENCIKMYVGEGFGNTSKADDDTKVKLATDLFSNVIPLQYLVKLYYYNPDLDYNNNLSRQVFRHLKEIHYAILNVSDVGFILDEEEMDHLVEQSFLVENLMNDVLGKKEQKKNEYDRNDEPVQF